MRESSPAAPVRRTDPPGKATGSLEPGAGWDVNRLVFVTLQLPRIRPAEGVGWDGTAWTLGRGIVTAQVAVLNRNGVALASDSAVTIMGNGGRASRSYNSADKIFPLCSSPVAVLHSGNASLLGVPWQVLVQQWSKARGEQQVATVEDYAGEFTSWLVRQRGLVTPEAEADFFRWQVRDYLLVVRRQVREELEARNLPAVADSTPPPQVAELVDETMTRALQQLEEREDFDGLSAQKARAWCAHLADKLDEDISWVFDDTPLPESARTSANNIAELIVLKVEPFASDAVLAFAGYGEDDFFPSLFSVTVSGVLNGVVRCYGQRRASISPTEGVAITPLGLTDAIDSFLRGSSPQYRRVSHDALTAFQNNLEKAGADSQMLAKCAQEAHQGMEDSFDSVEGEQFVFPMLDVVENLPMAETVRLADSLVGLATLRQMVRGETTVGGPVDLAQVTRDRGFEWIRNKHRGRVTSGVPT